MAAFPGSWRPKQDNGVALFEQIKLRVVDLADGGSLPAGQRLPAVRALAMELDVAPHTVARAYKELEAAAVVETRGRHGTVVLPRDGRQQQLQEAAAAFAEAARGGGLSLKDAVRLFTAAYEERG
ncbi:GntR family transcriptional regulator [Arthrobacter sp. NPDC090010]|uniref:GntR family transcriptional regulator n=1 Tax=Arthrobacter sp. NPDC090010 TaxID=3363942 RepID=UPI0038213934